MEHQGEEYGLAPILHILVVGFHHQKGCTLEYAYPPFTFSSVKDSSSLTCQLPSEWRHITHLALPDGCHNYEQDTSFFVLPCLEDADSGKAVYGISCCRQVDSKDIEATSDVTRSTIQKGVCVLSKYPFYSSMEAKISQVTQAYFEGKDFSNVSILQDALTSLNATMLLSKPSLTMLQLELAQQVLVVKFGHRLLQIFKALLLQKRVLLYGVPTKSVCEAVLSILSLFPKSTETLARIGKIEKDGYGFPLDVFTSPSSVQPYVCLQQMDSLEKSDKFLLMGVTNPLFQKQYARFCDLYVSMEDGQIQITDPKLRAAVYLTAADLRFCDYVHRSVQDVKSVNTSTTTSGWFGSNSWVRSQFKIYVLSLLATSLSNNDQLLQEFGGEFVNFWLKGVIYTNWKLSSKSSTGMSTIEPSHPCNGALTLGDVKLRLSAQATEYGMTKKSKEKVGEVLRQTSEVVTSVGGAMGGMWSAASSAVSSWWWPGEEDSVD